MITSQQVEAYFGPGRDDFVDPINKTLQTFDINTPARVRMFMAQIAHESGNLTHLKENLYYSPKRLLQVFPRYFTASNVRHYAYNPEAIANRVYANRYGNGPEGSGDGWRYHGRGAIQLTFKANYQHLGQDLGMDLHKVPAYLETPEGAVMSAGWYWDEHELNELADREDIRAVTKAINGGYNGLQERINLYRKAQKIFH